MQDSEPENLEWKYLVSPLKIIACLMQWSEKSEMQTQQWPSQSRKKPILNIHVYKVDGRIKNVVRVVTGQPLVLVDPGIEYTIC